MNGSVSRVWHARSLSRLAQLWAHSPNHTPPLSRCLIPLRSQDSTGILLAHLSQAAVGLRFSSCSLQTTPLLAAGRCPLSTSFYIEGIAAGARPRSRLQNAAEVALSSFASLGEIVATDAGYTDLALESRPLTGFYTTPRNGVIAIEAEFTDVSLGTFCACILDAFFLSLRNNRVIDRRVRRVIERYRCFVNVAVRGGPALRRRFRAIGRLRAAVRCLRNGLWSGARSAVRARCNMGLFRRRRLDRRPNLQHAISQRDS